MTTLREVAQQALEALENAEDQLAKPYSTEASRAITALRAALAKQESLEPDIAKIVNDNLWNLYVEDSAEPVAWESSEDGKTIQDNDFTHDVVLRVTGDFENDRQRISYAKRIVNNLNAAPAQRKPLTGEQLRQIELGLRIYCDYDKYDLSLHDFARAIEQAHGIE